jgi:hypothetical protein
MEGGLGAREIVIRRARARDPGASYFKSIIDEEQAYWLGFISADGWIGRKRRGVAFGVQLAGRDREHLARLALRLGLPVRLSRAGKVTVKSANTALVEDLSRAGIVERKSYDGAIVHALLRTPFGLRRHFIRGLFDGDGSAFEAGNGRRVLELSGHRLMLKKIRELAFQELAVARNEIVHPAHATDCFATLRWRHPLDIAKLTNWLYAGATFWLDRKRVMLEQPLAIRGASIYRGVYRHRSGRWGARVGIGGRGGRVRSAGLYDDEVAAAREYDRVVRDLVDPRAPLNLPDSSFCAPLLIAARI